MAEQEKQQEREGRWWMRPDGVVFRMDDPAHISRMLAEGWREIEPPTSSTDNPASATPALPTTLAEVEARNEQARAAFTRGGASGGQGNNKPGPKVKQIKPARQPGEEQ